MTIVTAGACRKQSDRIAPGIIARVGTRMVNVEEFKHYLKRNTGTELAQISPDAAAPLLDQYIEEILLSEYAAAHQLDAESESVTQAVRKDPGSTLVEKRDELRRGKLLSDVSARIAPPTDDQIQAYYRENPDDFRTEEQVHVKQILVRDEATARQILGELKTGAQFEALSQKYSKAPNAERGGEIGFVSRGQLPKIFEETIFQLKPGQVSDVVQTDESFHIFKVEARDPAGTMPLAQAHDLIRVKLEADLLDAAVRATIKKAQAELPVTVLTKRVPFPYSGEFPHVNNE